MEQIEREQTTIANKNMKLIIRTAFTISILFSWSVSVNCQDVAGNQQLSQMRTVVGSSNLEVEAIKHQLREKYDVNHNGKIDVDERRDYVKELAKISKAREKNRLAEVRQLKASGQGTLLQTRRGRETLRSFDKNSDGRLDSIELQTVPDRVWIALRVTPSQLDQNKDGMVDAQELSAAERQSKTN